LLQLADKKRSVVSGALQQLVRRRAIQTDGLERATSLFASFISIRRIQ